MCVRHVRAACRPARAQYPVNILLERSTCLVIELGHSDANAASPEMAPVFVCDVDRIVVQMEQLQHRAVPERFDAACELVVAQLKLLQRRAAVERCQPTCQTVVA